MLGNKTELHGLLRQHVRNNDCATLQLRLQNDTINERRDSCRLNTDTVRSWLQYCETYHGHACRQVTTRSVSLDLINCQSLCVETYDGLRQVPYVALSYVWGLTSESSQYSIEEINGIRRIGPFLPRVVSDAIAATKSIGFQYLWVDKFCIHKDQAKKQEQIRHMDFVYEKADLTIVAAAGSDENFGLPGVGTTQRSAPTLIRLGQATITWPTRDPQRTIRSSKWETRGWTFQESALSRRRLVFLEDQAYFECNSMNCLENIQIPLDAAHVRSRNKIGNHIRSGMLNKSQVSGIMHRDPAQISHEHSFYQYMSAVEQYTARELGQDADSLNAFEGLLRLFRRRREPLLDIWGLCYPMHCSKDVVEQYFVRSLSWYHTKGYASSEETRPRRRQGFPSWTWAGWAGRVGYCDLSGGPSSNPISLLRSAHLESPAGAIRGLASLGQQSRKARRGERILRLEGRVIPKNTFDAEQLGKRVTWHLTEACSGQVQYVLIGSLPLWRQTLIALVLRAHSTHDIWLRIGLCIIGNASWRFDCPQLDVARCNWSILRVE
ncbi:Heterokaryon incompatibility [Metarhizium guizhouense ARSEF 977]|uniref:Heterokaryon incompatibility n=1 Tax=Metarhizium guizhouense (strain ARSEF 977) TaxID=1276136 RepID=A0A0B4I1H5_METGA|nr:Heterokaryon incompatibility [Metarhizium guizhouense ARSEF 977]